MKRHALFVGVNKYDDKTIRDLKFSIPDASVLADRFKALGYKTRLLPDPTGAELMQAVTDESEGLRRGDVFLFFFAGHGFTAQDGSHLLFCRDHRQRLLRTNSAGVKVDALEDLTSDGGFHRAFLLDSCRTDCFAGIEGRGSGTTRDLDFVAVPEYTKESGSYFLLRSCDKFRPSLEFDKVGHGLFTQGLLDAMAAHDSRLAFCDTSFAEAIRVKMADVQRTYNVTDPQRPSIGECSGPVFSLFDKSYLTPAAQVVLQPISPCVATADDADGSKRLAEDNFQKGLDFYNGENGCEKDFTLATKFFMIAAESGNAGAQYSLAICYATGRGVARNFGNALSWMRRAAEQGDKMAIELLAKREALWISRSHAEVEQGLGCDAHEMADRAKPHSNHTIHSLNDLKRAAANGDRQAQAYLQARERSIRQDLIWEKIRGILDCWPLFVLLAAFLACLFWLLYVRSLAD